MTFPSEAFRKASFDSIEFAYTDITIKGGIRYTVHEFPHASGGEPEKMGRKAYMISFRAHFHDMPGTDLAQGYPDAYPNTLRILREKFETQITADLIVPTLGKIRAVAVDWSQKFDVRSPTGEAFDIEFLEDQDAEFLTQAGDFSTATTAIDDLSDELFAQQELAKLKLAESVGFFQSVNDAVTLVQGALGAGDAFLNVLVGKLEGLANLLSFGDSQLTELQDVSNHALINAMKDLALATTQLIDNVSDSQQRVLVYTVPKLMSIGQVSVAIYGTSERGIDILALNNVEDAFEIPPGTKLKYLSAV